MACLVSTPCASCTAAEGAHKSAITFLTIWSNSSFAAGSRIAALLLLLAVALLVLLAIALLLSIALLLLAVTLLVAIALLLLPIPCL